MLRHYAFAILLSLPGPVLADTFAGVIRVIDGDTIDVGSERVRIFGIDAPEADQTCNTEQGIVWDCGAWVTAQVKSLLAGRSTTCEALEKDRYGRTVARCAVEGEDIGRRLVSDGLALAYRRYSMDYDLDEKAAQVNDRGLHAVRMQSPAEFRKTRSTGQVPTVGDCRIKGNISSGGARIYHLPGQRDYERTGIRTDRGERWFCSVGEAQAAGWRAARR